MRGALLSNNMQNNGNGNTVEYQQKKTKTAIKKKKKVKKISAMSGQTKETAIDLAGSSVELEFDQPSVDRSSAIDILDMAVIFFTPYEK